jgi:hypothetical protein
MPGMRTTRTSGIVRTSSFFSLRNLLYSPPLAGFVLFNCLIHPPIILPRPSIFSESAVYFLLSRALSSQSIWRKNFVRSSFSVARWMWGDLSYLLTYIALNISPIASVKSISTFTPKLYRASLGICGRNSCQVLYAATRCWIIGNELRGGGLT